MTQKFDIHWFLMETLFQNKSEWEFFIETTDKAIQRNKKKDRSLELKSAFMECLPGRRKIAVKVVDIFGNGTMKIIAVTV